MAASTTIILSSLEDKRGILDTFISSLTPDDPEGSAQLIIVGTTSADKRDAIYEFDLTGIPKNSQIVSAILTLNIVVGSAGGTEDELAVEFFRLTYGLQYEISTLTLNDYDGINPWPIERFDKSIVVTDAFPTGAGDWVINDLKDIFSDSIRLGENYLHLVVRRRQQVSNHRLIIINSSEDSSVGDRPTILITYFPPDPPETVIIGNRRIVVNPVKQLIKQHKREGSYNLQGGILYVNDDGKNTIQDSADQTLFIINNGIQGKFIDGGLDGLGDKRLTNWQGRRATFQYGWNTTNTAGTRVQYTTGLSVTSVRRGYEMEKAGSIIAITMIIDINAINGSTIEAQVYKNDLVFTDCVAAVVSPIVANGQVATATFAVGTHTFVAGDDLSMRRVSTGFSRTTDDTSIMMEVEYDN